MDSKQNKKRAFERKKNQALPGYRITAPPSVCIPDVIGAQAVWIQQETKKREMMMIAFITIKSSLVPLMEGLCAQIYFSFEISVVCSHLKKFPPKNGVTPKLPSEVAQCL